MPATLAHLSPDAALLLLTAGLLLIYLELNRPGSILPGAIGLTTVLLAASVLAQNALSSPAIALILLGFVLLARNLRRNPSLPLDAAATLCLFFGFLNLIPTTSTPHIHTATALPCTLLLGISTAYLTRIARTARRNKGLD